MNKLYIITYLVMSYIGNAIIYYIMISKMKKDKQAVKQLNTPTFKFALQVFYAFSPISFPFLLYKMLKGD